LKHVRNGEPMMGVPRLDGASGRKQVFCPMFERKIFWVKVH